MSCLCQLEVQLYPCNAKWEIMYMEIYMEIM